MGKSQKDDDIREGVVKGCYKLVYLSPEAMLLNCMWREMFNSAVYQENVMCLAVDEAHCVEKWYQHHVCVCSFICLKPRSSLEKQFRQEYEGSLSKIFS